MRGTASGTAVTDAPALGLEPALGLRVEGHVTLASCWDLSAADWIAHSDLQWSQLVRFGPADFGAYARLRFLPDPVASRTKRERRRGRGLAHRPAPRLFEVLATHTTTPQDCYFCVWEGFGDPRRRRPWRHRRR